MKQPPRYRYTTPTGKGRWRALIAEAKAGAVAAKAAHRDEQGRTWLDVFTRIERDPPL